MFVLDFLVIFLSRMHCWWDRLFGPGRDVRSFLVLLVEANTQDHAFGLVAFAIHLALLWQRTITVCQTKRTVWWYPPPLYRYAINVDFFLSPFFRHVL